MTNSEKFSNNWCQICAFAGISDTVTECNLRLSCLGCACYNNESQRCHCHDEAIDDYCKYYKENGR